VDGLIKPHGLRRGLQSCRPSGAVDENGFQVMRKTWAGNAIQARLFREAARAHPIAPGQPLFPKIEQMK
jgi:hypothetical protein